MPPALLALAPLAAEAFGSFALPELIGSAGALGTDALGLGLTDATLGSIGGGIGGAATGALTNKDDPLLGGLLGGATGAIGGPGLADLGKSAVGGVGDLFGAGAGATGGATAAASGIGDLGKGAASLGSGAAGLTPSTAGAIGGAAASAAPATSGATPSISSTGPTADPGAPTSGTGPGDLAGGGDLGRALSGGTGNSLTGPGTFSALAPPGAGLPGAPPVPPTSPIAAAGGVAPPPAGIAGTELGGAAGDLTQPGMFDDAMSWLGKGQHGSELLAGLGLGATALQGNKSLPGEAALKAQAKQLGQGGKELESYMRSGTLPPGLQAGVTGATEAAKATLRSQFAQAGMTGSSSEAEALAKVDQQAQAQAGEMAIKLMQQGVDETNMSSQLYQVIMQNALAQDQELGKAVGAFASSFAPRPAYQPGA